MRPFAIAILFVCSWLTLDVLGCQKDTVSIFRREGGNKRKAADTGKSLAHPSDCGPPQSHDIVPQLKRPVHRDFPRWLTLPITKNILSDNACVLILNGVVPKTEGHTTDFHNPVIKVYKDQTERDMKFVLKEVSHLKRVGQYIDGVFEWTSDFTKMNVYILMVNKGVALEWNSKDAMKYETLKQATLDRYQQKYGMIHQDFKYLPNFAHVEGDNSKLSLLDWAHARYKKVPPQPTITPFLWPKEYGSLPFPPKPLPKQLEGKAGRHYPESSLPLLEKFIMEDKPIFLWGNADAYYYKLHGDVKGFPAAIKVIWVVGVRQHQALYQEITNLEAVGQYLDSGRMMLDEQEAIAIVYLVVKFQGTRNAQGLDREKLKKEAMERYKKDFGMVNTNPKDKYFIFHKAENKEDKDKAYIYDWSSARHEDLPEATLDYICSAGDEEHYKILNSIKTEHCSRGAQNKGVSGEPASKRKH